MKLIKCLLCSFSEKDDANSLRSKRKEFKGNRINWWWCKGSSWRWCVHLLKVFDYIWLNQLNDWLLNLKMKQKKISIEIGTLLLLESGLPFCQAKQKQKLICKISYVLNVECFSHSVDWMVFGYSIYRLPRLTSPSVVWVFWVPEHNLIPSLDGLVWFG